MTGTGGEDRAEQDRAKDALRRRREFIRAHHPDRGGDAEIFIAGLRAFRAEQAPEDPPRVVIAPHRTLLTRLVIVAVRRLRHDRRPARVR
jgi:hypothetical protein